MFIAFVRTRRKALTMAALYLWKIRPVSSNHRQGYEWEWSREDDNGRTESVSKTSFAFYYDCVMDAKKHGFDPGVPRRMR